MDAEVVEIVDRASGSSAKVLVSLGFNCFSWQPVLDDGPREMLWADPEFRAGDKRPSSGGIPLLFPFPGRIGGAKYEFQGREYHLEPGDAFGNAIHGFVLNRPWRIVDQSPVRVMGEFQPSVDDASILERWPSDFRIRVSYEVSGRELLSKIEYENTGEALLPCGLATHAYFRLPLSDGSDVADTVVTAPVDRFWELENMTPTGRITEMSASQRLAEGLRLDELQFDTVFTGIQTASDGLARTVLTDPAGGRTLTQTFDSTFTQCVVYTPGHRQAICLEPYSCVPDAIRLSAEGKETGLQILQPREVRKTTIVLAINR